MLPGRGRLPTTLEASWHQCRHRPIQRANRHRSEFKDDSIWLPSLHPRTAHSRTLSW